ncbi:hypothetical protein HMPREF9999_01044 [Alloprevotella sp. oral taxon 473 str. F0040]|nr:hypothetical protein HMPREF9999_01044 [Alloprevotella sp. oral taxon 473 str. F0040]
MCNLCAAKLQIYFEVTNDFPTSCEINTHYCLALVARGLCTNL